MIWNKEIRAEQTIITSTIMKIMRFVLTTISIFFFVLISIWSRHIEFSISTLSGRVLLLSLLYSSLIRASSYNITPSQFQSSYLSVSTTSMFSLLLHLLRFFSPHALTISISLLLVSHVCLPHLPIFAFLFIPIIHTNIVIKTFCSS